MKKISFNSLLLELLLYSWVFYFFYSVTFNPHYYQENLFIYLGIQLLFWFLIAIFTHKFKKFTYKNNYFKSLFPFVNSYILFFLITIPILYLFSFQPYVVKKIYFSTTIYILWSFVVQSFRYLSIKPQNTDEINLKYLRATTYLEIEELNNTNEVDTKSIDALLTFAITGPVEVPFCCAHPTTKNPANIRLNIFFIYSP